MQMFYRTIVPELFTYKKDENLHPLLTTTE